MRSRPPSDRGTAPRDTLQALRVVLRYARLDLVVLGAVAACVLYVLAQVSLPWAVGRIIDDALTTKRTDALLTWAAFLVLAAFVSAVARGASELAFTAWRERAVLDLRLRMIDHLHQLRVCLLEREPAGRWQARLMNDAAVVGRLYNPTIHQIVHSTMHLASVAVVLGLQYGTLALWAVAVVPSYLILPLVLGRALRSSSADLQAAEAECSGRLQESITGIREIKAFARGNWSRSRIEPALRSAIGQRLRVAGLNGAYNLQFAVFWAVVAVAYWAGGRQVLAEEITVGQLVAFVAYIGALATPLDGLMTAHAQVQAGHGALSRVLAFLSLPAEADAGPGAPTVTRSPPVVFERVSFSYADRPCPAVIEFDLCVEAGTSVAVVGPSGAGKSTLLRLLLRFHDPHSGRILMDGIDLRQYDLTALRRAIGVLPQEPMLFSGSVRENIRFGCLEAAHADVEIAAQRARAHDFILQLPEGYDTEVGERGVGLSVGQRQRVALARIMLRDPALVLLDEPTSALDPVSEHAIQAGLRALLRQRTSFVVAHRLATIESADVIIVLDHGRLLAAGTHSDLLKTCRLYQTLHDASAAGPGRERRGGRADVGHHRVPA